MAKVGDYQYIKSFVLSVPGDGTDSYTPIVFHRAGNLPTDGVGGNMRGTLTCGAHSTQGEVGSYYNSSFEIFTDFAHWNGKPNIAHFNHYAPWRRGLGNAFFSSTNSIYVLWLFHGTYYCSWRGQYETAYTTSTSGVSYQDVGVNKTASMLAYADRNQLFDTTFSNYSWSGSNFYTSGNVGIGTTNPSAKLDVAGKIKSTMSRVTVSSATSESTTSTSYVDLPGTSLTIDTGVSNLLILATIPSVLSGADMAVSFRILLDGTQVGGTTEEEQDGATVFTASLHALAPVSAGTHTIKIQWAVQAGTAYLNNGESSFPGTRTLSAVEL